MKVCILAKTNNLNTLKVWLPFGQKLHDGVLPGADNPLTFKMDKTPGTSFSFRKGSLMNHCDRKLFLLLMQVQHRLARRQVGLFITKISSYIFQIMVN